MAYELATPAIQAALIARLEADAALAALLKTRPAARGGGPAIYEEGDVYDGQPMPYLTIGLWTQTADHTFGCWGWTCTGQIKAISQTISRPPQVTSAVLTALEHGTRLDLPGYDSAWIDEINAQPMFRAQQAGKSTFELPIIVRVNVSEALVAPPPPLPAYQARILADGALAYWPLDDPSGTVARDLAGARHGTISGGVTVNQPGVNGSSRAMDFDGSGTGRIECPAITGAAPAFSLEAWVQIRGASGINHMIVNRGDQAVAGDYRLYIVRNPPNPYPTMLVIGGGTLADGYFPADTWAHLVVTHDGTTCTIYRNGAIDPGFGTSTFALPADAGLRAVTMGWSAEMAADMVLQDVAIYPRALTPAEISAHFTLRTAA